MLNYQRVSGWWYRISPPSKNPTLAVGAQCSPSIARIRSQSMRGPSRWGCFLLAPSRKTGRGDHLWPGDEWNQERDLKEICCNMVKLGKYAPEILKNIFDSLVSAFQHKAIEVIEHRDEGWKKSSIFSAHGYHQSPWWSHDSLRDIWHVFVAYNPKISFRSSSFSDVRSGVINYGLLETIEINRNQWFSD